MKGYCGITDIENYTLTEIAESFETNVEEWISMVEQYIEKETGRVFIADSEASERYFDGNGEIEFYIDEFIAITGAVIYDTLGNVKYTLTEDTHYLTFPYNKETKRGLIAKSYNVLGFADFTLGVKNVKITAKWGSFEAVPDAIKFATMVLVSGIVNFSNNADGEIKSEKIGDYSVTYKDEQLKDFELAKEIIGQYTKHDV